MSINSKLNRERKKKKVANRKKDTSSKNTLHKHRVRYTEEWGVTSSYFDTQGYYKWMSERVQGYQRIMEVGCGNGISTLHLIQAGHKVVSIDENPYCLERTKILLNEHGFSSEIIRRGSVTDINDAIYKISYEKINLSYNVDALLIEGDMLVDEALLAYLKSLPKFDGVACWLLGTHGFRGNNAALVPMKIPDSRIHRLMVQNKVYEVSDDLLRSGGLLNVIDRAEYPSTSILKDGLLDSHRDQASVTSLNVEDLEFIEYSEPETHGAIKMVLTIPEEYKGSGMEKFALTSISSRKP